MNGAICPKFKAPKITKSQYKLQMVNPTTTSAGIGCWPLDYPTCYIIVVVANTRRTGKLGVLDMVQEKLLLAGDVKVVYMIV